jgi:hypothetical protein
MNCILPTEHKREENMKKQIKKISIHQTSKVVAIIYLIISAIIYIPMGIIILAQAPHELSWIGFIFAPIFLCIFAYIINAIIFWIYNFIAKRTGGIEFSVQDVMNADSDKR